MKADRFDPEEVRLLREVRFYAQQLVDEMERSPAGDEYTFKGSMNHVEDLQAILGHYKGWATGTAPKSGRRP